MYKINVIGDTWSLNSSNFDLVKGSFREVSQFMVFDLDFEYSEIKLAADQMHESGHDRAHFGVLKSFIYSSNSKESQYVL